MRIRRRFHISYPGVLYVGVTVVLAIGAINSQNNLLFIALGLSIGALLVSGIMSGFMLMSLRIERDQVMPGVVGGPLVIRYTITNQSRFIPAFGLVITELPGERMRIFRWFDRLRRAFGRGAVDEAEDRERRRAWSHRLPRPYACASHIGTRSSARAEALIEPVRRGAVDFQGVRVTSSFPFGILRKSVDFEQAASALVRPASAPVAESLLRRIESIGDSGEDGSLRAGRGMEYHGLREYVPGDSMRDIAWRASARTEELVVRETAPPTMARVWIGVDLEPGTEAEDDNERAISLCAGLLERAISAGFQVGLVVPAFGVIRTPVGHALKGESAARRLAMLLDDLARLDLDSLDPEARPVATSIGHRDACIVIRAGRRLCGVWPRSARRIDARDPAGVEIDDVIEPHASSHSPGLHKAHAPGAPS